jgi:Na(+)-translocating NADH:ubiquinone oxidoreductase A subunit
MKFVGGYDIPVEGKPSDEIVKHQEADILYLPLFSRSFEYTALQVENGESVTQGQILATDPVNFFAPLLAPVSGTVNLDGVERHITLENLSPSTDGSPDLEEITSDNKRQMLLRLGVWSFMEEVSSGRMPDPEATPEAVIIALARQEPFFPSPEVFLDGNIDQFCAGLEQIHRVFDGVTIHLALPRAMAGLGASLQGAIEENGDWLKLVEVEDKYPSEHPVLVARMLELNPDSVWTLEAQALLAVDQALNHGRPNVTRIVSVSGPGIAKPSHFKVPIGYPLASLIIPANSGVELRILDGGVLTGRIINPDQKGLDTESVALTCLQENTKREVLAFAQAGYGKHSYTSTFASVFRPLFREKYTTALRGEARPCIFCGNCENVCPAEIIPHLIYRYLSKERVEDACRVGLDLCIECGLCSYVCTSKIEHLKVFRQERGKCEDEKDSRE